MNVNQVVAYYLEQFQITSPFGENRGGSIHQGTDFSLPGWEDYGMPVYSPIDCIVKRKGYEANGAGYFIVTGDGTNETKYFHLIDHSDVEDGQIVRTGDQIGRIGNSGNSTGPHLHMERWENGQPIDPVPWLESLKEEPILISTEDAEKIIRFLQAGWYVVEGNDEAEQEFHRLANEVRRAAGMDVE